MSPKNSSDQNRQPEQPTMVNPAWAMLEPPPQRPIGAPPEELADDIVARPLTMPDFATNIQPYLVNQNLCPRWIFTDRRRYAQAKAQGWRNCTRADLKPNFATLNPFEEENGTKYINGDLILMLMDRKRYLGALRRKHEIAERLEGKPAQKTIAMQKANAEMGETVATLNRIREASGQAPLMEVFDPRESDLKHDSKQMDAQTAKAIGRMGGTPDMGYAKDLEEKNRR